MLFSSLSSSSSIIFMILILINGNFVESNYTDYCSQISSNFTLNCETSGGYQCIGKDGGSCSCCQNSQVCFSSIPSGDTYSALCCEDDEVWCKKTFTIFDIEGTEPPFCCNPEKSLEHGIKVGLVEGGVSLLIFIIIVVLVLRKRKSSNSGRFKQNKFIFIYAVLFGAVSLVGEMLIWMGSFGSPFKIHVFTAGSLLIFIFILRTIFVNLLISIKKGEVPILYWGCLAVSSLVFLISFSIMVVFMSTFQSLNPHCELLPDIINDKANAAPRNCGSFKFITIGLFIVVISLINILFTSIYFHHKHKMGKSEYEPVTLSRSESKQARTSTN